MSDVIELTLSRAGYDRLSLKVSKTKNGTESVSVRVEDLEKLLIDHGRLLRAVEHKEPA